MNTVTLYNDEAILYRLYIGMNDKDSGKQELSNEYFTNHIGKALGMYDIEGYTMFHAVGSWNGAIEITTVVEIVSTQQIDENIRCVVKLLKADLNQQSIMVTKQTINVAF